MRNDERDNSTAQKKKVCRLTPAGRGAIQTLQVTCPAERIDCWDELPCRTGSGLAIPRLIIDRIYYGFWGETDQAEEIVICRCDDSVYEIHCHGGEAASRRILADLDNAGFRIVTWREDLKEEKGILETEFFEAISQATTTRTSGILLEQQHGLLRDAVVGLQHTLYTEKTKIVAQIDLLLKWSQLGLHLTQPWKIGIFGRPNVGKSSLLNALAGFSRSIVYDQPGTTRDLVSVPIVVNGWPFELIDTAGVRADSEELEHVGIEKAQELFSQVDLRLVLLDLATPLTSEDCSLCQSQSTSIIVFHKCDLTPSWSADEFQKRSLEPFSENQPAVDHATIKVSSKSQRGLVQLLEMLEQKLVPELPLKTPAIPFTRRQIALLEAAKQASQIDEESVFRNSLQALLD